ncbi:tyrosine-type recombinase/integrase [Clostridium sp. WILCCON 0269]|uniref:Tyrosine-type recombinase/integrase n=1 Tax=Candidatus Clostridium eludens TaxID=3381663 RepID=A0ABW8SMK8_9CLOT
MKRNGDLMKLDEFKEYLYDSEKSKCTVESYVSDMIQFFNYYKKDIASINKVDIREYTEYLLQNQFSIKTINRKLVSLNQYILFLDDVFNYKIIVKVKQLKIEQQNFINDMLDICSVRRIMRAAQKDNDVRAVTIFFTLFYTGARVSEMLQIKAKDITKDSIIISGKGNKFRELLIPKKLKEQWQAYNTVRINKSDYLFTGIRGAISRQTVHNTIKYYTGQARGIDKGIAHAHSFRHLYAQSLGKLGVNQIIIAQLLGHSLNVTGTYMQVSKRELLDIINKLDFREDEV